jgi:hypothetical protein
MKFQIGDNILVKQTGEEGILTAFLDDKLVKVRVNGVEYPIFENEIDHPYLYWFLNKKIAIPATAKQFIDNIPKEKKVVNNNRFQEQGIHLIFLPVYKNIEDDLIDSFKIYLSNNLVNGYSFDYFFDGKSGDQFHIQSEVNGFNEFYIHDIDYEDFANNPYFEVRGAEILAVAKKVEQFDTELNFKPKKLFQIIETMHQNGTPFFTQPIFVPDYLSGSTNKEQPIIEIKPWQAPKVNLENKKVKDRVEQPILPPPVVQPKIIHNPPAYLANPALIDLHIEKLIESYQDLSNAEMIEIQMNAFEQALDNAVNTNQNTLYVIHGVGKGVLKNKIHAILNQTKWVVSYVNEYNPRFGFGATEVFFGY